MEGLPPSFVVAAVVLMCVWWVVVSRVVGYLRGTDFSQLRLPVHVAVVLQDGNELETKAVSGLVGRLAALQVKFISLYHTVDGVIDVETIKSAHRSVHINSLSQKDGKPAFIDMVRTAPSGTNFTEDFVTQHLSAFAAAPDPDLMLVFGNSRCIYGFPAWPISVTEILFHNTVKRYSERNLKTDLSHYSSVKVLKGV